MNRCDPSPAISKNHKSNHNSEIAFHAGKRDIQVEFRAKIMDLAVSKELLDFPNGGEVVVRL